MSTSEILVVSLVDEVCSQSALNLEHILKLRNLARNNLSERKALQNRYGGIEGENLPKDELRLRQAAFAWILCRYEQAEAALKEVHSPLAQLIKGEIALDRGEFESAASLLKSAAEHLGQAPRIGVEIAAALSASGKADEALAVLERLEKQSHADADFHFQKGRALEHQGQQEAACTCYEKALELEPQHADAAFRMAYYLDLRGEDQRAIDLYKRVTGQGPSFVAAMINLALLLEDKDDVDGAITHFKEALKVDPTNRRAALYLRDSVESLDMYYDENERKENERLEAVLRIPIADFELSVRSRNCLAKMNIRILGDLARKTEQELLSYKNFGETSLQEIKNLLESKGLRLGMFKEEEAKRARTQRLRTTGPENAALVKPITDLELSVRSRKCMQRLNLETIGDLLEKSEADLLATKNFGQTSLNEVKAKLSEMGLSLKLVD